MRDQATIPVRKVLAGFLIAPLPPALLYAVGFPLLAAVTARNPAFAFQSVILLPWVLVVGGYLPILFVGLPLYALVRRWLRPTLVNCALAGAFVAVLPWAVIVLLTGWGTIQALEMIGVLGVMGAIGGSVFWSVVAGPWSRDAST